MSRQETLYDRMEGHVMKPDPTKWQPLSANNEAANEAQSVLSAAEFFLDAFGVGGASADKWQSSTNCVLFSWGDAPTHAIRVRWHTCCDLHPTWIDSVEFLRC